MTNALPKSQPIRRRPPLNETERTDMIVNEIMLLDTFPNHVQAEEFRRNVEYARTKYPALHAHAEMLARESMISRTRLLEHPQRCPRCQGSGIQDFQGRQRFCCCPRGERMMIRRQPLPQFTGPQVLPAVNKSDRRLLAEVASWIGEEDGEA